MIFDGKDLIVTSRFIKTVQLQDEYYVALEDPTAFIEKLWKSDLAVDLFTFVQGIHERTPKFNYHQEWDSLAVLPLTTYDNWFNKQITFKPRNKVRKAPKAGVEIKPVEFSDELVTGIMRVYNEHPIRQGKPNRHFGKPFEVIKREHATFLERSDFIGAYYRGELIGFAKVTHSANYSNLMNIVSMTCHRDKAPTNALLAKAIELTTARNIPYLNYGIWGRRGLNEFKVASGFECFQIPRYFVPRALKGKLALKLQLHHSLLDRVPEKYVIWAAGVRTKWYDYRYRDHAVEADAKESQ